MTQPIEMSAQQFISECDIVTAQATAEKTQYEAELAQWQAKREELQYIEDRLNQNYQLNGTYTFHRGVTRKSMDKLFEAMHIWHAHDASAPWTIYVNSGGGDVFAGNGIIDEIASHSLRGGGSHEITIKVRGQASSMAGMILQAADVRVMGRYSLMMIHTGSMSMCGTPEEIKDVSLWLDELTEWMVQLFLSRTHLVTREQFLQKIDRREWWLNSEQALELGFVDHVR